MNAVNVLLKSGVYRRCNTVKMNSPKNKYVELEFLCFPKEVRISNRAARLDADQKYFTRAMTLDEGRVLYRRVAEFGEGLNVQWTLE